MKKLSALLAVFLFVLVVSGCERDDVCPGDTPTTPRLILEFYNNDVTTSLKAFTMLDIREIDSEDTLRYTNASRIEVPLRTDTDSCTWIFTINPEADDPSQTRTDTLTFSYSRENLYVSRACGFKTVFTLNNGAGLPPAIVHQPANPLERWMRSVIIDNYFIELETNAHLRILW